MSAAELIPPDPRAEEFARSRQKAEAETRDFPTIQAMAIAKARDETYSPERHGPFAPKPTPKRRERVGPEECKIRIAENMDNLLERFRAKAKGRRHLQAVPNAERPGVERVRDL